ncbi:hypothetical protein CLAFUW4_10071 [Fulvia fulva]|nr:hypothetical protein CLAFUR4_10075 [Fulvia fulva]KAK4616435.1 hypothetical protein CLAFUR0_10073 [Fulvia fulva]WPV19396.1 hypothetical protein CLAFUW4_10071 [Fulvia fulva]WPV34188.1 hypothetical protein CLAFUW7_10072 [Fulvia fulva]
MRSRNNLYLTYKKDTSLLLYWVINTSNGIVKSGKQAEDGSVHLNTTGRTTVAEIVNMARLIAKHLDPIPFPVFRLFKAIIKARSATHAAFQQIVTHKPDPEIERANETHKHFIDALTEAFEALGGASWEPTDASAMEGKARDDVDFQNQFSALSLGNAGGTEGENEDDDGSEASSAQTTQTRIRKQPRPGKGKHGKRGKKAKSKGATSIPTEAAMADIPVESYRIIEDGGGLVTDYLMAVYAVVGEWMDLRLYTQDLWREVAYDGLNSAVAAALTNIAISMVKRTCIAVFAEFPGHESYDTIINTMTRGDLEKAQTQFGMSLYRVLQCGHQTDRVKETFLDVKEQFWVHAYNDLVDFITDFRKNRGKPTKAMQAQLDTWTPTMELQRVTNEDRVRWRRLYTISWLYDLVNVFSSIVVQRNTMKGEHHIYENVDWSNTGPWHQTRRLFGLSEFAGDITTLAMQKQGTDIKGKILPHHVFQLQCIVDSFAASRGWTVNPLRGHILAGPSRRFRPRRDVDLFLDRENERLGHGVLQSIDVLKQLMEKDCDSQCESSQHSDSCELLELLKLDFVDWLGESRYMYGLKTIPPSSFSKHNSNGLWEYSPLLCAAGLVEGIVIVQRIVMQLWDNMPEPTLAIHLHNMLVEQSYLESPTGLYATIVALHQDQFFPDGIPTENFSGALSARVNQGHADRASLRRRTQALARDPTKDIHDILDVKLNRFFTGKSDLMMYYDAGWAPERVPDADVRLKSILYMMRVMSTERMIDPETGERRLKETELVKRASRDRDRKHASMLQDVASGSILEAQRHAAATDVDDDAAFTEAAMRQIPALNEYKLPPPGRDPYNLHQEQKKKRPVADAQGRDLLTLLRPDLFADVCGNNPVSSVNYVWVTCIIIMLFVKIEDHFSKARHPLWIETYERSSRSRPQWLKRVDLVVKAMASENEDAMRLFAKAFEEMRGGILACVYWEDLKVGESGLKEDSTSEDGSDGIPGPDQCTLM